MEGNKASHVQDNDASYVNNQSSGTDDNAPYLNIGSTTKYDADGNGTNNGDTQVFLNDKNGTVNRPVSYTHLTLPTKRIV